MSYRIDYGSAGKFRKPLRPRLPPSAIKSLILVAVLVTGAILIKLYGLTWIQEVLLPGDPQITQEALQNMTDNLKNGDSLLEAVTTFCQEIVANAQ